MCHLCFIYRDVIDVKKSLHHLKCFHPCIHKGRRAKSIISQFMVNSQLCRLKGMAVNLSTCSIVDVQINFLTLSSTIIPKLLTTIS